MSKMLMSFLMIIGLQTVVKAQIDTPVAVLDTTLLVKVQADPRFELLGKKLADYNVTKTKSTSRSGNKIVASRVPGYRLMVVNSSDRTYAFEVRGYLMKQYSGQHDVHMTFVNPYIKLKFGDFTDRNDAIKMRAQLIKSGVIKGNIYILPEQVIVKRMASEMDEENQ